MKLSNKGFTLVELLAVIAIIAILGFVAVPSVINTINTGKESSYQMLVENIYIAGKSIYEEIEYADSELYVYKLNGATSTKVKIIDNCITINLQTLVSNGFLSGINNSDLEGNNKNPKIVLNPKNNNDIGECSITIQKIKNGNKVNYSITNNSSSLDCPTDEEYKEGVK